MKRPVVDRCWIGREGLSAIHPVATVVAGGPTPTRRASLIRERSPYAMIQVSRPSMLTQIQYVKRCGSTARNRRSIAFRGRDARSFGGNARAGRPNTMPKYPSHRAKSLRFDDTRSKCEPDGPDGNSKGCSRRRNNQVNMKLPTTAPRAMIKDRRGTRRRSLPGVTSKIPDDAFSWPLALNQDASALIALRGSDLRRGAKV